MNHLWFVGIDPARDQDYLTVVIHGLNKVRTTPWLPKLRDMYRYKKQSLTSILQWLINDCLKKYPPTNGFVDETRDPTFAEILVQKFPSIQPLKFGNSGSTNTKLDLKLIGRDTLNTGYTFPDVDLLLRQKLITPDKAHLVTELKEEALREVAKLTNNDRITFDHPAGMHNDLVHAWEMSLKAVLEYQKSRGMGFGNQSLHTAGITEDVYYTMIPESSELEQIAQARLQKRGIHADAFEVLGNW